MAAGRSRCGHYIIVLWFLLHSIFFSRLFSAVADWISTILPHRVSLSAYLRCRSETCCKRLAESTGRKKSQKIHHLRTIAQLCRAIYSQLRHVSTMGKIVEQQYVLQMSPQYGELPPTIG